eukprot:CAMPEP_0176379580 /NCGR_PEP_ID=MMETSP0126-20121128/30460_1 /TAXON_ID=141414 ORGANISM="Strombidinopsis acuminatum, Strain SPMC142" /NCGR_SAMPLE_ID=MMETSP0126 /ASSEMBLY_ACC=CAM_ASM_000229 /LENGTH=54 /DNA_ID=CAMNT_0017742419 /DNA_START=930 /DNA_END=1094 /DNA_ORIENTATION=+
MATPAKTTITAKDFMNDFATEDFLAKNIRVTAGSMISNNPDNIKEYTRVLNLSE